MRRRARPGHISDARSTSSGHVRREVGQSVTEFALILPILVMIMLAIADFARLYSAMIAVQSAAREAADSGTLYPWQWTPANRDGTVAEMRRRACVASNSLTDYVGPDDNCANPQFAYSVDTSAAGVSLDGCPDVPRLSTPCNVKVNLSYTFKLIFPGQLLGLPPTFTFQQSSVFAISDFEVDTT